MSSATSLWASKVLDRPSLLFPFPSLFCVRIASASCSSFVPHSTPCVRMSCISLTSLSSSVMWLILLTCSRCSPDFPFAFPATTDRVVRVFLIDVTAFPFRASPPPDVRRLLRDAFPLAISRFLSGSSNTSCNTSCILNCFLSRCLSLKMDQRTCVEAVLTTPLQKFSVDHVTNAR